MWDIGHTSYSIYDIWATVVFVITIHHPSTMPPITSRKAANRAFKVTKFISKGDERKGAGGGKSPTPLVGTHVMWCATIVHTCHDDQGGQTNYRICDHCDQCGHYSTIVRHAIIGVTTVP